MNIYEKLQIIQSKLKAPKSQRNNFGNYNYRNCEDILEAVKPLLEEVKAAIKITDEVVLVGERYYIKAKVEFINTENGESLENTAFAREEETKKGMDGSQITGASSSYARKYALNGLFAIDDTKDSDTTNTGDKPRLDTKLLEEASSLNIELEKVATFLGKAVEELTSADLKACIEKKKKQYGVKK